MYINSETGEGRNGIYHYIEEMISQDFAVDAVNMEEAMKLAEQKYNMGVIYSFPGNLTAKQMSSICPETNEATEWVEF